MSKSKMEWRSIKIPLQMYANIKKVIVFTGHPSVPEYIREQVNHRLTIDLMKVDELQEKIEEAKEE